MVKVIGLALAVFACWTCAPAQADVASIQVPPVATPAPVQDAVAKVTPTVTKVTKSVRATPAPTRETLRSAAGAAQPAAVAVAKTTVRMAQGRAGDSRGLRVGASSVRRAPSARLRRSAPEREPVAPLGADRRAAADARPAALAQQAPAQATAEAPAARPERQSPPNPVPAPRSDGGISAGASGLAAGGLAMLAFALILVAPYVRRSLCPHRAALRPVAFVALLERPG